jgi:SNF2 family DNA or RNA helicase
LGAEFISGASVKAALDIDWDNPEERSIALSKLLVALQEVENWLEQNHQLGVADSIEQNLKVARQVQSQDVEVTANGTVQLRHGVAKNRRISVEDPTMRHGRKSRNQRFDGYKRHVLTDLDIGIVRAVGLTPANVPEAWVSDAISNDLKAQDVTLVELQIDRAYLSSKLVRHRTEDNKH